MSPPKSQFIIAVRTTTINQTCRKVGELPQGSSHIVFYFGCVLKTIFFFFLFAKFRPHDCILLVVSVMVAMSSSSDRSIAKESF